jgi:hypothetical protein
MIRGAACSIGRRYSRITRRTPKHALLNMNEFERDRALRIEENKRRMVEMGILSLSSKVAADATIKPTPVRDDALSEDRVVAFARSLRLFFPTDRSGFPPMTFVDRFDSKHGISRREFARNTPFYLAIALSRQNTITRSPEIAPTPVSHSAERRKRESSYRSLSVADRRAIARRSTTPRSANLTTTTTTTTTSRARRRSAGAENPSP